MILHGATDAKRPTVTLPNQGKIIGITIIPPPASSPSSSGSPVEAFLGIPYAVPPTGDRRFRPAAPLQSPQATPPPAGTVLDASRYGPSAPGKQLLAGGPPLVYDEDCLTANVFRPAQVVDVDEEASETGEEKVAAKQDDGNTKTTTTLLPVAVYIHGGAFNRGTASMHNTASMVGAAARRRPFVAVSFNYRIGALGFLPSGLSAREGVLNLGLRDQIVLFEWVRDNIRAFGGDPGQVTLVGLSAGAHSVCLVIYRPFSHTTVCTHNALQIGHHLMHITPGQKPLFHRVVIESGAPTSRAVRPPTAPVHEAQFADFLAEAGVPPGLPEADVFPFLRRLPSEVIQRAQVAVFDKYNPSLQWAFQPVIDGDTIPRPPLASWQAGAWHKVPIMTGFQRNEGSLYVDKAMRTSDEFVAFFRALLPLLSEADLAEIDRLYPDPAAHPDSPYREDRDGVGAQYRRVEAAYGHYAYVAPVRQTVEFAASASSIPVYLYQWAAVSSVLGGAQHADNMRYEVCDPKVVGVSANQAALARTVNRYVTNFIATGDPNDGPGPEAHWAAYDTAAPKAMVFGLGNEELIGGGPGTTATLMEDAWGRKECAFWWSKVELSQQ